MRRAQPPTSQSRDAREAALEKQANRLLAESLQSLGRGEYPFFSQSHMRRRNVIDEQGLVADEAIHPHEPIPSVKIVWRLARKARLSSIETDVLRLLSVGEANADIARLLSISTTRVRRIAERAIAKMTEYSAQIELDLSDQIACVLHDEQSRRAPQRERHCKPGQELCRRTGICPRRWYVRQS